MTRQESSQRERPIYEADLQTRLDAAIARTQRFLNSPLPIRATTFAPSCLACQQAGRLHRSLPTSEQHYICAHCHRRWVAQPSAS